MISIKYSHGGHAVPAVKKIRLTSTYVSDRVFDGARPISSGRAAQLRALAAKNKTRNRAKTDNKADKQPG
jgi:hypothetical protein